MGLALSWFASSVGQALAFLLGRYLFRASVKAYLLQRVPNFPQIVSGAGWRGMRRAAGVGGAWGQGQADSRWNRVSHDRLCSQCRTWHARGM